MTDALQQSFAVTFHDRDDDRVTDWLARFRALLAELEDLPCTYQDTARDVLAIDTIGHEEINGILLRSGVSPKSAASTTCSVMQALFDIRMTRPKFRVRFYCKEYGHEHGFCECSRLINDFRGSLGRQYRYLSSDRRYRFWLIDLADLLALTDAQLAEIKCHPKTRDHLIVIIAQLRGNPTPGDE